MKVHRYSRHQRKQWVLEMRGKHKTVKQICAEAAISRATLYIWLKEFAAEFSAAVNNSSLPALTQTTSSIAWEPLDAHKMLQTALLKADKEKVVTGKIVSELAKRYTLTIAQACQIAGISEEEYDYKPRKPEAEDRLVYEEILRLLAEDGTRGLDECTTILQQTKPAWPRKQIKRIYRQGRLYLKRTRARATRIAIALQEPQQQHNHLPANQAATWHTGIIAGDESSRQSTLYAIDYGQGTLLLHSKCSHLLQPGVLVTFLAETAAQWGVPKKLRMIAQPPFNSHEVTRWAWDNKVALYQLSLAKPENKLEAEYLEEKIKQQLLAKSAAILQEE